MPARYSGDDILMLGRESAGVPEDVADAADLRMRIPMRAGFALDQCRARRSDDSGRGDAPDRWICEI